MDNLSTTQSIIVVDLYLIKDRMRTKVNTIYLLHKIYLFIRMFCNKDNP